MHPARDFGPLFRNFETMSRGRSAALDALDMLPSLGCLGLVAATSWGAITTRNLEAPENCISLLLFIESEAITSIRSTG